MATLNKDGSEILDQTPVALPIKYERPEPLHQRIRRMILQATMERDEEHESIEDFNDFEIPEDPSSYDTEFTEPDLEPAPQMAYTDEEIAAARAAVEKMRAAKAASPEPENAGDGADVSSSAPAPAEPA